MKLSFYLTSLILLVLTRFISSSLLKLPYNLLHLLDIPSSTTDCENNVCSINTNVEKKNMTNDHGQTDEAELTSKIAELGKLGWNMEESRKALLATDSDIEKAIASLEETEEKQKELSLAIENITDLGWRKEAAESAYLQNNRDITAAIALLESEEVAMQSNFESSVNDMLANGWHELVARQALMTQYAIDERQQAGLNTTMDEAALKDIRPTLKQPKEDPRPKQSQSTAPKSFTRSSSSGSSKTKSEPKVTPAKKEDVVFEVTSDTFQKLVIESPVPVIVDVYADWCGPCKQLGPILEEAAVNSGGMFRLAKVNCDNERSIAQALDVSSLPSVFAVKDGKVTDKFLGMLPAEQIKQFLVRLITGYGEPVQPDGGNEKALRETSDKMISTAGLASLTFKKKELFQRLVADALESEGAFTETNEPSEGLKTALAFIGNAAKDIMNPKFRKISTSSKAYTEKILPSPGAVKLLAVAGFKLSPSATDGGATALELGHKNAAILTLVTQRVTDYGKQRKFNKGKPENVESVSPSKNSKSLRRSALVSATPSAKAATSVSKVTSASTATTNTKTSSAAKPKVLKITKSTPTTAIQEKVSGKSEQKKSSSSSSSKTKKSANTAKQVKKGTHTLHSSGILSSADKQKGNEYFGGDSTVVRSMDDDDNDDDEEEAVEEEEEEEE